MADNYPAKLCIPLDKDGNHFEFTVNNSDKTKEFEQKVLDNCPGVSTFALTSPDAEDTSTMGQLKRGAFQMRVNSQTYTVFPDIRSVLSQADKRQNHADTHMLNEENTSMSLMRQKIVTDFYDHFVTEANKGKSLGKDEVKAALDKALANYAKADSETQSRAQIQAYLEKTKEQLAQVEAQHKAINRKAHARAGMCVGLGFLGTFGQLTGLGYAIYGVFDWNAVEPMTWIFQSFYMMVGSFFFMRYKSDWQYTSVYDCLYKRNLKKFAARKNFDLDYTAALREYVEDLEGKLESMKH